MKMLAALVSVMLGAGVSSAAANWAYQKQESAFGDGGTFIMLTVPDVGYGLGLRCLSTNNPEVMYVTPDTSFNDETMKLANLTEPLLKIRIDEKAVIDIPVNLIDVDGTVAAIGEIDLKFVEQVRDAQSRIAVVLTLLGDNFHEKSASVRGSTAASVKLINDCSIE